MRATTGWCGAEASGVVRAEDSAAHLWAGPDEQYWFTFKPYFETILILKRSKDGLPLLKFFHIKYEFVGN
jgi:hypothetical protein